MSWIEKNECDDFQRQPTRDVLKKRYSENVQQIYRTPMLKSDFNDVLPSICCIFSEHVFLKNTSGRLFCISYHSVQHYMWIPEHATIKTECFFLIIFYVLLIEWWLYLKDSQFQISSKTYRKNVYLSISFFVLFLIFNDFMISFPRCIFLSKARKFLFCKSHKIIQVTLNHWLIPT